MFGKLSLLATAATLGVAAIAFSSPADARIFFYGGYYAYAPGFYFAYPPAFGYAPSYGYGGYGGYGYGGRTYDWYRRDFQLRGRDGA